MTSATTRRGAQALRRVPFALLGLCALGVLLVWGPPLCPMHNLFGVPCPGCGLTRATLALARGDFGAAFHYHPLVFVMLPVLATMFFEDVWRYATGKRLALLSSVPAYVWWPVFFAMIGVWLARFAGFLGGPVDPVDFAHGMLGRALHLFL